MDIKRILTSIIGIPAVVLLIAMANKYIFGIGIMLIGIICMYEYFSAIKKICKPIEWVGYIASIMICIPTFLKTDNVFTSMKN